MASSPSEVKQQKKIPSIDYTSRDFTSIKADLKRAIPYKTPEWTDLNESDLGIVLLDLLAHSADVLHFYLDRNANEAFLQPAITRRSVINILKLIGYELRSASPASVDLLFTIPPLSGNLTIPAGTKVQTSTDTTGGPIFFETVEDLVILAGQTEGMVGAIEGESKVEQLPPADGIPNSRIVLDGNPIIDGTLQLFIDEGIGFELWLEVDSFIESIEDSKHFTAQRDELEVVTLFLGDNVQGKVPVAGSASEARYRIGGGARGNVGADTITAVVTPITFDSSPVAVEVTNPLQASGGEERQSIEEAKILGPRSLQTLDRAVTPLDFETLVEQFPGVAAARVTTSLEAGAMNPLSCCCEVLISIAPEGGGPPSSVLKEQILEFFETRKMIGTCVRIVDPVYVPVDVTGVVFAASNFDTASVALELGNRIAAYFDLAGEFIDFGTPVFFSDLVRLIDETPGVDHVDLSKLTRRAVPTLEVWEVDAATFQPVVAGEQDVETCEESIDETWTVIFVSPTQYTLKDGLGQVVGTFNLGQNVTCDLTGDRVQFKLVAGAAVNCPANRASFRSALKLGNVPMDPLEIPIQGAVNLTFVGGARAQRECP